MGKRFWCICLLATVATWLLGGTVATYVVANTDFSADSQFVLRSLPGVSYNTSQSIQILVNESLSRVVVSVVAHTWPATTSSPSNAITRDAAGNPLPVRLSDYPESSALMNTPWFRAAREETIYPHTPFQIIVRGWPWPVFAQSRYSSSTALQTNISLNEQRILWFNLLKSIVTLGIPLAVFVFLAVLISRTLVISHRMTRGRCPLCGYSLFTIPVGDPCPECGWRPRPPPTARQQA
jgi:hypothetical protein